MTSGSQKIYDFRKSKYMTSESQNISPKVDF